MKKSGCRAAHSCNLQTLARIFALTAVWAFALGCTALAGPSATPTQPELTATDSPSATLPPEPTPTPTLTPTPTPSGPLPIWGRFAAPRGYSATSIPPPMPPLELPDELRAVILAGLDRPNPYPGRSDMLILVIYHPRLSKAVLVSIPPDLFGYIPGQTMQRMYAAYPLGGGELLQTTIEYNLGIHPDYWLAAHIDDFPLLIDELGGLTVPIMQDIPNVCGDILYQGDVRMNGAQTLCYASLREGQDEAARGLRQQQILRLILDVMVRNSNLTRVNDLFTVFRSRIDTNLTLQDTLKAIPLVLRLGDPSRTAYFQIGPAQTSLWQISDKPPAEVFLPRREAIRLQLEQAVEFVNKPSPLNDIVVTLEFQLTHAPLFEVARTPEPYTPRPTMAPTSQPTPTITPGPSPTRTRTPIGTVTTTPSPIPTTTATFSP